MRVGFALTSPFRRLVFLTLKHLYLYSLSSMSIILSIVFVPVLCPFAFFRRISQFHPPPTDISHAAPVLPSLPFMRICGA